MPSVPHDLAAPVHHADVVADQRPCDGRSAGLRAAEPPRRDLSRLLFPRERARPAPLLRPPRRAAPRHLRAHGRHAGRARRNPDVCNECRHVRSGLCACRALCRGRRGAALRQYPRRTRQFPPQAQRRLLFRCGQCRHHGNRTVSAEPSAGSLRHAVRPAALGGGAVCIRASTRPARQRKSATAWVSPATRSFLRSRTRPSRFSILRRSLQKSSAVPMRFISMAASRASMRRMPGAAARGAHSGP